MQVLNIDALERDLKMAYEKALEIDARKAVVLTKAGWMHTVSKAAAAVGRSRPVAVLYPFVEDGTRKVSLESPSTVVRRAFDRITEQPER